MIIKQTGKNRDKHQKEQNEYTKPKKNVLKKCKKKKLSTIRTLDYCGPYIYYTSNAFTILLYATRLVGYSWSLGVFLRERCGGRALATEFAVHNLLLYNYVLRFPHRCDSRKFC